MEINKWDKSLQLLQYRLGLGTRVYADASVVDCAVESEPIDSVRQAIAEDGKSSPGQFKEN